MDDEDNNAYSQLSDNSDSSGNSGKVYIAISGESGQLKVIQEYNRAGTVNLLRFSIGLTYEVKVDSIILKYGDLILDDDIKKQSRDDREMEPSAAEEEKRYAAISHYEVTIFISFSLYYFCSNFNY